MRGWLDDLIGYGQPTTSVPIQWGEYAPGTEPSMLGDLGKWMDNPVNSAGIGGMAQGLLANSGWHRGAAPTFGEALGAGMRGMESARGRATQQEQINAQLAQQQAEQQRRRFHEKRLMEAARSHFGGGAATPEAAQAAAPAAVQSPSPEGLAPQPDQFSLMQGAGGRGLLESLGAGGPMAGVGGLLGMGGEGEGAGGMGGALGLGVGGAMGLGGGMAGLLPTSASVDNAAAPQRVRGLSGLMRDPDFVSSMFALNPSVAISALQTMLNGEVVRVDNALVDVSDRDNVRVLYQGPESEDGWMAGKGLKNQALRTLYELRPKIMDGTATEEERERYRLAGWALSKPASIRTGPDGESIAIPGQSGPYGPFPYGVGGSGGSGGGGSGGGSGAARQGGDADADSPYAPGITPLTPNKEKSRTPEQAGKIALTEEGRDSHKIFRDYIFDENGEVNDRRQWALASPVLVGDARRADAALKRAIETKLRLESGAAVPETEVQRAAQRYRPHPLDNDQAVKEKMAALEKFLDSSLELADPELYKRLTGKQPRVGRKSNVPGQAEEAPQEAQVTQDVASGVTPQSISRMSADDIYFLTEKYGDSLSPEQKTQMSIRYRQLEREAAAKGRK